MRDAGLACGWFSLALHHIHYIEMQHSRWMADRISIRFAYYDYVWDADCKACKD